MRFVSKFDFDVVILGLLFNLFCGIVHFLGLLLMFWVCFSFGFVVQLSVFVV